MHILIDNSNGDGKIVLELNNGVITEQDGKYNI